MKIIFLGTGACVASLLVEAQGDRLLFDCGSGTIQKLESIGIRVSRQNRDQSLYKTFF